MQAVVEARAKKIPSDGTTPWDERLGDAFMDIMAGADLGRPAPRWNQGVYVGGGPRPPGGVDRPGRRVGPSASSTAAG